MNPNTHTPQGGSPGDEAIEAMSSERIFACFCLSLYEVGLVHGVVGGKGGRRGRLSVEYEKNWEWGWLMG